MPHRDLDELVLSPPKPGGTIFVLVHGTFARNSRWARVDAPLGQMLLKHFPDAGIAAFRWTGWNQMAARFNAAAEFGSLIDALRARHRGSPVVAIAHSHGGNVVHWSSPLDDLSRAVYVNTPFLHVIPIKRSSFRSSLLLAGYLTGHVGVLLALALAVGTAHPWVLVGFVVVYLLAALWVIDVQRDRSKWFSAATTYSTMKNRRILRARQVDPARQLVVSTIGDEALTGLTGFYVLQAIGLWCARALLISLAFYALLALAAWFFVSNEHQRVLALVMAISSVGVIGFHVLITAVAMCLYGVGHGLLAGLESLVVSAAPDGVVDILTVRQSQVRLRHSSVLTDLDVIEQIIEWLRNYRPVWAPWPGTDSADSASL